MFNVDVLAISPCTWDCPDYGKRGASLAYQPHIKVMQYTGLKDKNGVEIYEGDIVKIPCDIPDSMHGDFSFHEVVYRNGTWINQYLKSETGFKLPRGYTAGVLIDNFEHQMKSLVFNDNYLTDTEIEVVGSVYENPELVGGK